MANGLIQSIWIYVKYIEPKGDRNNGVNKLKKYYFRASERSNTGRRRTG